MKVIYKYPVEITSNPIKIGLPIGSQVLTLQMQGDIPCIWISHTKPKHGQCQELHTYQWFGTGHEEIPDTAKYIGTIQIREYVFHLFRI